MKNTVKINDKDYLVKLGFRTTIKLEKLTGLNGNAIDMTNLTVEQGLQLAFASLFGGAKGKLDFDYDEFMDIVEDNPELHGQIFEIITAIILDQIEQAKKSIPNQTKSKKKKK